MHLSGRREGSRARGASQIAASNIYKGGCCIKSGVSSAIARSRASSLSELHHHHPTARAPNAPDESSDQSELDTLAQSNKLSCKVRMFEARTPQPWLQDRTDICCHWSELMCLVMATDYLLELSTGANYLTPDIPSPASRITLSSSPHYSSRSIK